MFRQGPDFSLRDKRLFEISEVDSESQLYFDISKNCGMCDKQYRPKSDGLFCFPRPVSVSLE